MEQLSASAVRMTCSTAFLFITGREPGIPVQTGQQRVFGSPPKALRQPQNILLSVSNSAWHSMPMTGSYFIIKDRSLERRPPRMPVCRLLVGRGGPEERLLVERFGHELQPDRQAGDEAAGQGDGGQARQVGRQGADVVELHLQRIGLFAD